jgi:IS30 family transposase
VVYETVRAEWGIARRTRTRSRLALTTAEREEISRQLAQGHSVRMIGRALSRAASTIRREVRRNGGLRDYRAAVADQRAWQRSERPQLCRLSTRPTLRNAVAGKLAWQWSPQPISGWLQRTFPSDPEMQVSAETIYRRLVVQSRGVLKRALIRPLRRQHHFRHARARARRRPRQGQIRDAVSIRERPAEVQDRALPGHWEGDLLEGARGTFIATLVERQSRFVMLVRLPNKETQTVIRALARRVAAHRAFTMATTVDVYFCDPQSPWQRGSNENTNGLLRQYLPRGADLSKVSQGQLDAIALRLNTRPRMTLDYQTPAVKLAGIVAATG